MANSKPPEGCLSVPRPLPALPFIEQALVVSHHRLGGAYLRLELEAPRIAACARPGQFALLRLGEGLEPLLRRPLAFWDTDPERGTASFLYVVVGAGTRRLQSMGESPGPSRLSLLGPLGRGFWRVEGAGFHVALGGGCGIVPLYFWMRRFPPSVPGAHQERMLLWGGRDHRHVLPETLLDLPGVRCHIATDDGSRGFKGTVVELLASLELPPGPVTALYAAGPRAMLKAVESFACSRGNRLQVALEERMACGVGACRGCVVGGRTPHPEHGLSSRTVCCDGPVFDAGEVILDERGRD